MKDDEEWTFGVRVVCTGRGSHPSRELADLRVGNDPELKRLLAKDLPADELEAFYAADLTWAVGERAYGRELLRPDPKRENVRLSPVDNGDEALEQSKTSWRFQCPSCRRDFQIRNERLRESLIRLAELDTHRLDISLIP